jgi:hypothetical protein
MKKLALASLLITVASPFAAFANEPAPAAAPATTSAVTAPATTPATTAPAVAEVKPVAAELKDGTKIEITGDKVEVVGKDGKKTPAPDAEHTLKDGSKVTTKGGVIVKK